MIKQPPIRAHADLDCLACMEPIHRGSIIYKQKGCNAIMCQKCAIDMCQSRIDSSGKDGYDNGDMICTTCTPHHVINPLTIARTVPLSVFRNMQVSRAC